MLMGGKVPNTVFQEPKHGPFNTSQFDLTSVASTVGKLFNLSTPLSRRTMWSGTFDELLLPESRPDSEMPMHLPEAPLPSEPWVPPPTNNDIVSSGLHHDDDEDEERERRRLSQEAFLAPSANRAQHCGASDGVCRGHDVLSVKQERLMRHYAELTQSQLPDVDAMGAFTPKQADRWLAQQWELWRSLGHPTN